MPRAEQTTTIGTEFAYCEAAKEVVREMLVHENVFASLAYDPEKLLPSIQLWQMNGDQTPHSLGTFSVTRGSRVWKAAFELPNGNAGREPGKRLGRWRDRPVGLAAMPELDELMRLLEEEYQNNPEITEPVAMSVAPLMKGSNRPVEFIPLEPDEE